MKERRGVKRVSHNKGEWFFKFMLRSGNEHGFTGIKVLLYFFKRPLNFFFHLLAQFLPYTRVRVIFHKMRGVSVGPEVQIGVQVWIEESFPDYVTIEKNVSLAFGCRVVAHSIPHFFHEGRFDAYVSPVLIKEGAWIGMCSIILPGVTIGKGSVVSAGSVVIQDVPPFTIVRGNPAEIVGKVRTSPEEREEMKNSMET